MMTWKGKILFAFLMTITLCLALARTGHSVNIYEVISPKRFEKFHFFPVRVVVRFSQGARPETFRALLNGVDITGEFKRIEDGMNAIVGLENGLRIKVKTDLHQQINVLKTSVEGLQPDKHGDFETFFFVEVDELTTIGSEGKMVKSPDGHVSIDIPRDALSSNTTIGVTKAPGSGPVGSVYQLSPEGVKFKQAVIVSMKYDPMKLPPGVTEDALLLVLGNGFPRKLENLFVDKRGHSVTGATMSFSKLFISYYTKIGKNLTDIPKASDFRLPVGDNSFASYSCGRDYQSPAESDLGETLALLERSSYANLDYPKIILNENGLANTWYVITAYNQNRYINSVSGPTPDSLSLYEGDISIFSNGEDWKLVSHRDHGRSLPIHAISDGLVIYNGWGHGHTLVLAHQIPAGAILSLYADMGEKSPCAVGSIVHKGNVIGRTGRVGTGEAYLHYEIGKKALIKVDTETGQIKVPATWFSEWTQDSVYEGYYDPTNFLFNIMGKHNWDFNVTGNDEGWVAKYVKKYDNGYMYQVRDGSLSVKPRSSRLRIKSYPLKIETASFDSVLVRMRSNALDGHGKVFFATDEEPGYSLDKASEFEIHNDGKFHEYPVFMADSHKWKGAIVGIRIDLSDMVVEQHTEISFDNIRFGRAYLSRIPDTGQTKCYDNSQGITCPAPQDPFYGQDAHYVVNPISYEVKTVDRDEVVIDHVTGLTWQRHDDGIKRTWREASDYCENLTLGGYSDWRLPTKKELQSIANYGSFGPALDTNYFPYSHVSNDFYWSATTRAFLPLSAWKVCFWNSQTTISVESDYNYVKAVRGSALEFGHFRDNRDGTVTDITTGLMWQQTDTNAVTWEEALAYCENLDLAGYHDWRLPNIRELLSLVDDSRSGPAIDIAYFPGCQSSFYWSGTSHALYTSFAWNVGFHDAQVHSGGHKGRRNYVRAVRGE
jgi:hypothetical protein